MTKYVFDVLESNKVMKPIWRADYDLTRYYGLSKVSPAELSRVADAFVNDYAMYKKFCYTFTSGAAQKAEDILALGQGTLNQAKIDGRNYFTCMMTSRTHAEFAGCVGYRFGKRGI